MNHHQYNPEIISPDVLKQVMSQGDVKLDGYGTLTPTEPIQIMFVGDKGNINASNFSMQGIPGPMLRSMIMTKDGNRREGGVYGF